MRINFFPLTLVGAIGLFASGCAYNDRVDNRVSTYDLAAERARDEMILTNIIRASHAEPLAFVQLGQVTGGATFGGQLGLPGVVLGPAATTAATQALQHQVVFGANAAQSGFAPNTVQMSGSTTFNVTPSETKDFYLGLLAVVEPQVLTLFIEQGIAPEVLFYLFTDKIIEDKDGKVTVLRNDPLDHDRDNFANDNYKAFQTYVDLAMRYGLTAEQDPANKEAILKEKHKAKQYNVNVNVANGSNSAEPEKIKTVFRLCFDKTRWTKDTPPAGNAPICNSKEKSIDDRTITFFDAARHKVKLTVQPRSTFGIFQFLGKLVAANEAITLKSRAAVGDGPLEDHNLFVVTESAPGGCFLDVNYESKSYCVPAEGAANTKRILGLLAQLLALNTSVSDIPITPQVQVLP
jgi:hypothetical protein